MSEVYIPENISAQEIIDSLTKSDELQLKVRELGGVAILDAFMIIERVIIAKDDNPSLLGTLDDNSLPTRPDLVYIGTGEARLNPDGYYRSAVLTVRSCPTNETTPDIELEIASSEDF